MKAATNTQIRHQARENSLRRGDWLRFVETHPRYGLEVTAQQARPLYIYQKDSTIYLTTMQTQSRSMTALGVSNDDLADYLENRQVEPLPRRQIPGALSSL